MRTTWHAIAAALLCTTVSAAPPTVTIDANPKSGVVPYQSTITWSSTGAVSCEAQGAWNGSKSLNGSQVVTVAADSSFRLECQTAVGRGEMTVNWTAPTSNTDGSVLTNLAGYEILHGAASGALDVTQLVTSPSATSARVGDLESGRIRYFAMRSVNGAGVKSNQTNVIMATPVGAPAERASRSVDVTATKIPNPPSNVTLTVREPTAMSVVPNYDLSVFEVSRVVGNAKVGSPCECQKVDGVCKTFIAPGGWFRVNPLQVSFTVPPSAQPKTVVARCG